MPATLAQIIAYAGVVCNQELTDQQIVVLLNLAHLEEVESYPWGRLQRDFTLNSFGQYTQGTVTVAQGSPQVVGVGTNWTPSMTGMYFAGATLNANQPTQMVPIPINAVVSPTQLNLRAPYPLGSGTNLGYQIFPMFYSIVGLQHVIQVRQQVPLGKRTHRSINLTDPYRMQRSSPSIFWAPFGQDDDGNAKIELWPIEVTNNPYGVYGLAGHTDLADPTDMPLLPSGMLIAKTLLKIFETRSTQSGDARYLQALKYWQGRFEYEKQQALDADREEFGVVSQVQDGRGDPDTGGYTPGLDAIYSRDPYGV